MLCSAADPVVEQTQDLLCCDPPSLLQGAGDIVTRQDHDHTFKSIHPRDTHFVRQMEEPIRSCMVAGNLIVWLAKTTSLANRIEEHHGGG